ncbi:hypothetical protein ACWF94_28520 [Streptomyces sp. NPDC055078]
MESEETTEPADFDLSSAAVIPVEILLRKANPALRAVLERQYDISTDSRLTSGTFNSFIEADL